MDTIQGEILEFKQTAIWVVRDRSEDRDELTTQKSHEAIELALRAELERRGELPHPMTTRVIFYGITCYGYGCSERPEKGLFKIVLVTYRLEPTYPTGGSRPFYFSGLFIRKSVK